jgi:hypothetical protein
MSFFGSFSVKTATLSLKKGTFELIIKFNSSSLLVIFDVLD